MRSRNGLPGFVERGGELCPRPPFLHSRTRLRCFWLKGDPGRLKEICDRSFNLPSGGATDFRPLSSAVLLTFATIERIASTDHRDRELGWSSEIDVAFWIPMVTRRDGAPRLAWTIPYIFVDNPFAMASGREIYGFPKTIGTFTFPDDVTVRAPYTVDAIGLALRSPETRAVSQRMFEVVPIGTTPTSLLSFDAFRQTLLLLGASDRGILSGLSAGLTGFGAAIADGAVPIVLLRQLRDMTDPSRAAYQEIIEAPARVVRVHRGGLIPGGYEVRFRPSASHPIADDLGMNPNGEPVTGAFWVDFDFVMDRGRRLFCANDDARPSPAPARRRRRKRIALLGGGIGALSAAFALTERPGFQAEHEITVYQMGFRLGGKGASGRNADCADRIEEHGLHVWFGFYENAFRMIRRVYDELARDAAKPLATWRDAFKPHSFVVLQEYAAGGWIPWPFVFPKNDALPGDDAPVAGPREWIGTLVQWIRKLVETAAPLHSAAEALDAEPAKELAAAPGWMSLLSAAARLQHADGSTRLEALSVHAIAEARRALRRLFSKEIERRDELRRWLITLDLAFTSLYGMVKDEVLHRGFDALDESDFIEWLERHGALEMTRRSAPIRAVYDLVFGYQEGDIARPNFGAGTALRGLLRMLFTYKGAFMWKMQAGMGDTVFTPLYELLRRRGVKFEFFHEVRHIGLTPDGSAIDSVRIGVQATPKRGTYEPLVQVKGIACWPDRPIYDELVEGQELMRRGVDLESSWSDWQDVGERTLRAGEDFDMVVLGIPPGALPPICTEITRAHPSWRRMIEHIGTVPTLAAQLWLRPNRTELGWSNGASSAEDPILGAYVEPIATWADMTHLIDRESWPSGDRPGHLAYLCGPLGDIHPLPPWSDGGFPARERDRVRALVERFLERDAVRLWPNARRGSGFDWSLLVDPSGRAGRDRLLSQVIRANVQPSDRYVLSLKGSTRHRLRPDGSGIANLYLAGDWTYNGLNVGCIEAAVMSGLSCARAIAADAEDRTASGPHPHPPVDE
jgi:uncharacterized protein with NAD-binding domain and iron-sulfur cluster